MQSPTPVARPVAWMAAASISCRGEPTARNDEACRMRQHELDRCMQRRGIAIEATRRIEMCRRVSGRHRAISAGSHAGRQTDDGDALAAVRCAVPAAAR